VKNPATENLAPAFTLIREFKAGAFPSGTFPSIEQQSLVQLLAHDLNCNHLGIEFQALVLQVAEADSYWNKAAQECASEYYSLIESKHIAEANRTKERFLSSCPSAWYSSIVEAL